MRILLTAMPFAGHARPVSGVAEALVRRGHEVVAYTGARYAPLFERVGCRVLPWREAADFDERDLPATFPQTGRRGPLGVLANLEHVFVRTAPGQVRDLLAAHAETPFDAVAGDVMVVGTHLFARLARVPWATLSILPLTLPSRDLPPSGLALHPARGRPGRMRDAALRPVARALMSPVDAALGEVRRELSLGRGDPFDRALYSGRLTLAAGAPLLEYPRADLPDSVRFIGRFEPPAAARGAAPSWMPEVAASARPVVLVTQGTLDTDPDELIRPALAALADLDALVVATIEPGELGGGAPANARCAPFVSFAELLPHVDLAITNGGWGGVLEMLAHGVPLVVAGGTLDKPEIAARVAWSGAGVDLRTGRPSVARLRSAVRGLGLGRAGGEGAAPGGPRATDRGRAAARIGAELRALGGAARAAELIETSVRSR